MKLIPLSGKLGGNAILDDSDYPFVKKWKWKNVNGRAMRNQTLGFKGNWRDNKRVNKSVLMHRLILGEPVGMDIDHINGNPLDNRRANLRICTHQENRANNKMYSNNSSGYKGVYLDRRRGKFAAQVRFMGKSYTLAVFEDAREAAMEYDNAAKQLFGEFASLNFKGIA